MQLPGTFGARMLNLGGDPGGNGGKGDLSVQLDFGLPPEVTPASIDDQTAQFCRELAPGQPPLVVPVRPEPGLTPDPCVPNVVAYLTRHGGQCQLGWWIRQRPGIFLRAQFHACWVSPAEEYCDVLPKAGGETKILFLPDLKVAWQGKALESRFKPLSFKREIHELAALYRKEEQLRYDLPIYQAEYDALIRQISTIAQKLAKRIG